MLEALKPDATVTVGVPRVCVQASFLTTHRSEIERKFHLTQKRPEQRPRAQDFQQFGEIDRVELDAHARTGSGAFEHDDARLALGKRHKKTFDLDHTCSVVDGFDIGAVEPEEILDGDCRIKTAIGVQKWSMR